MITLTIYEDSGPKVSNHGTSQSIVENIGWRNEGTPDTVFYANNPIVRPYGDQLFSVSYKKYNYLKVSGTYPKASRVRITISGVPYTAPPDDFEGYHATSDKNQQIRLFYKLSNIYEQPNKEYDGELMYVPPGGLTIYPTMSMTGPESATGYPQYLDTNTTYYTQYLITQLWVPVGPGGLLDPYGNLGDVNIEWSLDEYEDNNV